ncbi:sodium-dependent transporter [Vibrio mangrovi]|uniref:Sodium-dependent transporter n=1 Tax=Vibrio mangrovi TaxID=474394 RepID=A0A1Y6IP07_9VIBR|nr:sodium-dependent transporter [Vibrio mangrovi]MDW6003837.1 sodium-dependent transporter [Vibrio mangrovi]SMR99368.1 Sodium:neurotransmitter symporter family protein [Vibrio mangrovi]
MASNARGHFSSKLGFVMAAAGSAVGLGNVWGFPTKAASNGGAAFLVIYLAMVFLLAFPMLVAELTIGRYGQANPISSLRSIWTRNRAFAGGFGLIAIVTASLILSFYSIIAGWLVSYAIAPTIDMVGFHQFSSWLVDFGTSRNLVFTVIFSLLTILVVQRGVADGIERWSTRLMPLLFVLFGVMILYIFTQDGAMEGLKMYLVPDLSQLHGGLFVDAMGQAFFSLSLGCGSMMVYGSYLKKDVNIPKTAAQVASIDTGVAFSAGLLILPAMFVAKNNGVDIFTESGALKSSGDLVFKVLPAMFDTMGGVGLLLGFGFFVLMVIAALTSAISMLEVPVSCAQDELGFQRSKATWLIGGVILLISVVICLNFGKLFGFVADLTTVYMQPLLGTVWAIVVGWIWKRNQLLNEIKQGNPEIEQGFFWKIWPWYVRFICPVAIIMVFVYPLM